MPLPRLHVQKIARGDRCCAPAGHERSGARDNEEHLIGFQVSVFMHGVMRGVTEERGAQTRLMHHHPTKPSIGRRFECFSSWPTPHATPPKTPASASSRTRVA